MSLELGKPRGSRRFCLPSDSHPLRVCLPGCTQPSQPDGSDLQGPPIKPNGTAAGHAVPSPPVVFPSRGLQSLVDGLLWARGPLGLEGCEFAGSVPNPCCSCPPPTSPGPEGSPLCISAVRARCHTMAASTPLPQSHPTPESPLEISGQIVASMPSRTGLSLPPEAGYYSNIGGLACLKVLLLLSQSECLRSLLVWSERSSLGQHEINQIL